MPTDTDALKSLDDLKDEEIKPGFARLTKKGYEEMKKLEEKEKK